MTCLTGSAVSVHPFFNDDRVAEAARVVEIAAQGRNERAATTAILVRNRSHLIDIIPRLREAGLRFRAIEIEGLGHRPVVQDLLALTRALAHPRTVQHGWHCCERHGAAFCWPIFMRSLRRTPY